jgi:hypothetical protein
MASLFHKTDREKLIALSDILAKHTNATGTGLRFILGGVIAACPDCVLDDLARAVTTIIEATALEMSLPGDDT